VINLDRDRLFAEHRRVFGALRQSQVEGLNAIADGMESDKELSDPRHAAYMLATAWHETAFTMLPIVERGPRSYFDKYDPVRADTPKRRERAREMGNVQEGDGYRYRGRGYVQLTWRNNYALAGRVLNVDQVDSPDLALQPGLAYRIMSRGMIEGWFTGKKLSDYIHGSKADFIQARRVINGTDEAAAIARYAERYRGIIEASMAKTDQPSTVTIADLPVVRDGAGIGVLQRLLGVDDDGAMGQQTYRALIALARP
jgi:predicted chitinase